MSETGVIFSSIETLQSINSIMKKNDICSKQKKLVRFHSREQIHIGRQCVLFCLVENWKSYNEDTTQDKECQCSIQ